MELSAPNGKTWTQPVGLFIDNEFVQSSNGQKLTTVNPTYVPPSPYLSRPALGCEFTVEVFT